MQYEYEIHDSVLRSLAWTESQPRSSGSTILQTLVFPFPSHSALADVLCAGGVEALLSLRPVRVHAAVLRSPSGLFVLAERDVASRARPSSFGICAAALCS